MGGCGGEVQPPFLSVPADVPFGAVHDFMSWKMRMLRRGSERDIQYDMIELVIPDEHQSEYSVEKWHEPSD